MYKRQVLLEFFKNSSADLPCELGCHDNAKSDRRKDEIFKRNRSADDGSNETQTLKFAWYIDKNGDIYISYNDSDATYVMDAGCLLYTSRCV